METAIKLIGFLSSFFILLFLLRDVFILEEERKFLKTKKNYKLFLHPLLHMFFSILAIGLVLKLILGNISSSDNVLHSAFYVYIFFNIILSIIFYYMKSYLGNSIRVLKESEKYKISKNIEILKKNNSIIHKGVFCISSISFFGFLMYLDSAFGIPSKRTCIAIFLLSTAFLNLLMFYKYWINPNKFLESSSK